MEFLGLPESHRLVESDLETAMTVHLRTEAAHPDRRVRKIRDSTHELAETPYLPANRATTGAKASAMSIGTVT